MVTMTTPATTTTTTTATKTTSSDSAAAPAPAPVTLPVAVAAGRGEGALGLVEVEGRKVRKPYTISKSRESWTEPEHDKFLEALQLFDRDWKKIEAYIGSKTVIQIRSHAQKYFLKVQKNGTGEHLPPPRPKRKASRPYPQKASKNIPAVSQVVIPQQSSSSQMAQGYTLSMDASNVMRTSTANAVVSSSENGFLQPVSASHRTGTVGPAAVNNCSSSTESPTGTWFTSEVIEQDNQMPSLRVMPDFAQVYSFLGSVFDPSTSGHLQKLKEMDPIDVETALLLMRNLSINLTSPDFEAHRQLLLAYSSDANQVKSEKAEKLLRSDHTLNVPFVVTSG